jgi:hypothetical protein
MPLPLAAIGLGIQAAGGLINFISGQSAADKAALLADENFRRWMAIQLPNPQDQQLALKQLSSVGSLSPQLEAQINQAPSEMNRVQADPTTKAAQMNALQSLQDQAHGGLSLQDEATLQEAQTQNQNQARGNSGAIMQDLARRGASNSGFGVAAQLSNAQNTANQNATAGLSAAAAAQQRALEAIQSSGDLGAKMQAADLGQQNSVAKSKDAINQFNTQNLQNVQQRNVASLNDAQAGNLGNAQRIADANVGIGNNQQRYNKELLQQNYENQVKQAQGANNAAAGQANAYNQQAANTQYGVTNLANGASDIVGAVGKSDWWKNYQNQLNQSKPASSTSLNSQNQLSVDKIKNDVDDEEKRKYAGG